MSETDEEVIARLKAGYSRFYAEVNPHVGTEKFYRDCLYYYRAEIVPVLPSDKNIRILEIGCATGSLLRFLCESGYTHAGGIELERSLYEEAVRNVGGKVEFLECGDALDFLRRSSGRFDMIIAVDVIEHFTLAGAPDLCGLVHRALNPGGQFLIRTPNMANILGCYARYMGLTHLMGYTETSLRELLLLCGFERAEVVVPKFGWLHLQTIRTFVTNVFHRILFAMQGQPPCVRFDSNIVMVGRKAK